jgi:acyl carrier protein
MKSDSIGAVTATESIEERVLTTVADLLEIDRSLIKLESVIEELVPDSLDQVRLFMALEDELGETVSERELNTIRTLADIVNYLRQSSSKPENG